MYSWRDTLALFELGRLIKGAKWSAYFEDKLQGKMMYYNWQFLSVIGGSIASCCIHSCQIAAVRLKKHLNKTKCFKWKTTFEWLRKLQKYYYSICYIDEWSSSSFSKSTEFSLSEINFYIQRIWVSFKLYYEELQKVHDSLIKWICLFHKEKHVFKHIQICTTDSFWRCFYRLYLSNYKYTQNLTTECKK